MAVHSNVCFYRMTHSTIFEGFRTGKMLLVALACGLAGYAGAEEGSSAAAAKETPPPPEVGVIVAEPVSVPFTAEMPGRVRSVRVAQVRARVAGILQEQTFREGSDVKKGDVLFQIDPTLFEANVASAKANVARAEASIVRAEANLTQANLLSARYDKLAGSNAVSQQERDNATSGRLQAEAEVKAAEADLLAMKAALKAAELDLSYTKVDAPISGRIGRALVTEGALVGQGEVTLLAEINQMDPVYVDFIMPANELTRFKRKAGASADWNKVKVELMLDDGSLYEKTGKLLFSEITVDPGTGSVTLRAEFPNDEWMLWPGMYVRGKFAYDDGTKAVLIPQQAVIRTAAGASVYVVNAESKLELRPVSTAEVKGSNYVQRSGFMAGEKIVVEGAQRVLIPVQPGSVVTPKPWSKVVKEQDKGQPKD